MEAIHAERELASAATIATLTAQASDTKEWKSRQNSALQHIAERFDTFREELRKEIKTNREELHKEITADRQTLQQIRDSTDKKQRWMIGFLATTLASVLLLLLKSLVPQAASQVMR